MDDKDAAHPPAEPHKTEAELKKEEAARRREEILQRVLKNKQQPQQHHQQHKGGNFAPKFSPAPIRRGPRGG